MGMSYIANFDRLTKQKEIDPLYDINSNEFFSLGLQSFSCEAIAIAILKNKTLRLSIITTLTNLIKKSLTSNMEDKSNYYLLMKLVHDLDFMAKAETVQVVTTETDFADMLI